MKAFFTFFILLLISFSAPVMASDWQSWADGLSYKTLDSKEGGVFHVFKVDPLKYSIKPILAQNNTPSTIKALADQSGAVLAVNANFFDENKKPLGLIKKDGKIINPLKKVSWWGVLSFEKDRVRIVHTNEFADSPKVTDALQTGPRLVVNGITPVLKQEVSPKTAIAITRDHKILFVVSQSFIAISELSTLLSKPEKDGGLGAVDALNLDGGSSTQIYTKMNGYELSLPSYVGLPSGLGVFSR